MVKMEEILMNAEYEINGEKYRLTATKVEDTPESTITTSNVECEGLECDGCKLNDVCFPDGFKVELPETSEVCTSPVVVLDKADSDVVMVNVDFIPKGMSPTEWMEFYKMGVCFVQY